MSEWLFLSELLEMVPELNRRSLMTMVRSGLAPAPTRLTPRPRNPRFRRAEVAAWLAARGVGVEAAAWAS